MQTTAAITEHILSYFNGLDWPFIITFMILCYGMNHYRIKDYLECRFRRRIRSRYLVITTGVLYVVLLYVLRGYQTSRIEPLLQSLIFSLVFHKLIIDSILLWLAAHGLPASIAKHLFPPDTFKTLYKKS